MTDKFTVVMGGNFDPPHIGHFFCVANLLNCKDVEEVWLVPAGDWRYDKKPVVSANHRVKMLEIALAELSLEERTVISKKQLEGKDKCYTYDLLTAFSKEFKEKNFAFAIGEDRLSDLVNWYNYKELIKQFKFFVIPREEKEGSFLREAKKILKEIELVYLKNAPTCSVSSTYLRQLIKEGKVILPFITPKVSSYIVKNGLYR
ncbi:MAG: nicotinate (nicotinamide) nucleotide adenylyltransferase [Candidatus Dadabacteria bacterium]|nr:MAG: nicotinate (nicotinamide) nucleotide adenylyltransferase [Candidatus Dadabacteria bacterium]